MKNIVGRRIRDARISNKMTQRDLADAAEISSSYMNLIESGRRPIAGTLLNKIANILQVSLTELSDDVSGSLIEAVWPMTSQFDITRDDLEKLFIENPKWMKVLQGLGHEMDSLKQQLDEVTNSLNFDSGFSETFHDLLSRIASIRSTASILNTQGDLAKEKDSQFRDILHKEARNASDVAKQLMVNFEQTGRAIGSDISSLQRVSTQLFEGQYYVEFLENCGGKCTVAELRAFISKTFGEEAELNPIFLRLFVTFSKDIAAMPKDEFLAVAQKHEWDYEKLAACFDVKLDRVLRRTAMLSGFSNLSRVSLNIYDQMGNVWLASPVTSFSGYKKIGCSLWPIFHTNLDADALSTKQLKIGDLDIYDAHAASGRPDLEALVRSSDRIFTMISFSSTGKENANDRLIDAHVDCRACNKMDCLSRRNRAISEET